MSGQPSPSASKKAHPDPMVSGRYFLPARPLLWTKWMPACAVTSVNTGPAGGAVAGITSPAAAREKRTIEAKACPTIAATRVAVVGHALACQHPDFFSPSDGRGSVHFMATSRSEEHTSELQSRQYLVCRLL